MIVGSYSYTADGPLGRYTIPGLPPGDYEVWIEPLDGSPVDSLQINSRIQFTRAKDFPEDWYSGDDESGAEADPNDPTTADPVVVAAGNTATGIDIIIENSVVIGCMNAIANYKSGQSQWSKAATQVTLLLPLVFLFFMKRRNRHRKRNTV